MMLACKPADAVAILMNMTPDRFSTLLAEIPPAYLGRMVTAARPEDKEALVAALAPGSWRVALSTLSTVEIGQVLSAVADEFAWTILADMSPEVAANIYAELPDGLRRRLQKSTPTDLPSGLASAMYVRAAVETIVQTATRTAWLDQRAGDVLAEIFGKSVHIAVRYRSGLALGAEDIVAEARRARWEEIVGLLVFTNREVSNTATNQAAAIRRAGSPIEVVRWTDVEDNGALKRSLVRLAG
jgi:hypothetical protein